MPALTLYSDYSRQEVHDIFSPDTRFTPSSGTWGLHGIVDIPDRAGDFIFFVTFGQNQGEHTFDEWITEEGVISWQSQPRQSFQDRRIQQFIHHDERKNSIHLFLRTKRSANYTYFGKLKYLAHDPNRENPVYMYWQLLDWPVQAKILDQIQLELQPAELFNQATSRSAIEETKAESDDNTFVWRGVTWQVNRQELISQVRDWISRGLPKEATRYKGWHIEIYGHRISPKWLFHLITGVGYQEFIAPLAREKLSKIGILATRVRESEDHFSIGVTGTDRIKPVSSRPEERHVARSGRGKPNKKTTLSKDDQPQVHILESRINAIRQVLAGSVSTPSDEVVCDWVHFCYDFGLYRKGQLLFTIVASENVNSWYYERTKKVARLCSMKANLQDEK